jgi:hypothetical protein
MDDEDATARRANRLTRLAELANLASQSDAGQPQVQARLPAPNAESGVVDVAGQSPDARLEPTPLQSLAAQADRLEKALAESEARKKAAAEMAAKSAPHLERLTALHAQLQALPQSERREVLDAIGLHKVSAAPPPITRLRGGGFVGRPAPQRQPARWALWLTIPRVALWQAVLLSLGIEPDDSLEAEACGRVPDEPLSFNRLSREFFFRRVDCLRALSTEGPIRPQGSLYVGMLQSPRCPVLLAEVAAFLARIGATVPIEMQATPAAAITPTAQAEPAPDDAGGTADAATVAPSDATGTGSANEAKKWLDIALPYILAMLKSKQFGTAKELFHALEADADSPTSPFSKGVGPRRGELHLRKLSQSIALKTFQNRWSEIRAAANLH